MQDLIKNVLRPVYHYFGSKNQRVYSRLNSAYSGDRRFTPRLIRFLGYTIDVTDSISVIHQFKEIFLDESYKFKSAKQAPLIYDCGANVGMSILYFRRLYPQAVIRGFEADPKIFSLLQKNVERNAGTENIELHNKAVWINDLGVEFMQEGADGGSITAGRESGGKKVKVESIRLKDWLLKEAPDFLKMDIEGAEVAVLLDCGEALSGIDKLFVEYHSRPGNSQQLDDLLAVLRGVGFRYFVESPIVCKTPFEMNWTGSSFDLQLNIYCYRA